MVTVGFGATAVHAPYSRGQTDLLSRTWYSLVLVPVDSPSVSRIVGLLEPTRAYCDTVPYCTTLFDRSDLAARDVPRTSTTTKKKGAPNLASLLKDINMLLRIFIKGYY